MKNKAYIVVNDQQEREVLEKLEREGFTWLGGNKPTENMPSNWFKITIFPYIIFVEKNTIAWNFVSKLEDEEIVFDGRKEEKMSDKYVVSQEFMDDLEWWKAHISVGISIDDEDIHELPSEIYGWWYYENGVSDEECNNRLIAILRWVNGEDVFEVEKPKKWVVRSKKCTEQGRYLYVSFINRNGIKDVINEWNKNNASHFDTKEEAESWANSHQEVRELIEVKE